VKQPRDAFTEPVRRLTERRLSEPGALDVTVRQAAAVGAGLPAPLAAYVEKVRRYAYRVMDEDAEALVRGGLSEEQVLELTEAAAFGAALTRLDAALAVLGRS